MAEVKEKTKLKKWVIDWHIEGSFFVNAATADGAQAAFDKAWDSAKISPLRDGEVGNSPPYEDDL